MKKTKREKRELRVGAVIAVAIAIIISAMFAVSDKGSLFSKKISYSILFDSTPGLFAGDPVLLMGVEVGNVTQISFPEDLSQQKIEVDISIAKRISSRIREDSHAAIASASLVYGKVVSLTMGSSEKPVIPPGGIIPALESKGFNAIVDSTNLMVYDIRQVIHKINEGEGLAGMMLNESLEMRQTLDNLNTASVLLAQILLDINQGRGAIGALLSDSLDYKKTFSEFQKSVENLNHFTDKLNDKKGLAGLLVNDEEAGKKVMEDLQAVLGNLANITAKIDTGYGTAGALVNDPGIYIGLNDVIFGMERSPLTRWMIRNRRKSGEKARIQQEAEEKP